MKKNVKLALIAISANLLAASLLQYHPASAQTRVTRTNSTRVGRDSRLKEEIKQTVRLPFISDVYVLPSASNAIISFRSSQRTPPLVEIGRVPPAPDRFGVMAFPHGTSLFTRFVQIQNGRYTLNFNATNEQLDPGTTYYYIINVFNDNQNQPTHKREQETGQISTFSQSVKVVWERIDILNDSDDGGAGEISLWFWINYGQPGARGVAINNLGKNSASTGETFPIDLEYTIEEAPNDLSLSVSGFEDDTSILSGIFSSRVARGANPGEPLSGPSRDANFEYNVARENIDLTRFPSGLGETVQEFKLVSMPNGGALGNLSFEIYGRFEVTRRMQ
jgi:hypothetical protein